MNFTNKIKLALHIGLPYVVLFFALSVLSTLAGDDHPSRAWFFIFLFIFVWALIPHLIIWISGDLKQMPEPEKKMASLAVLKTTAFACVLAPVSLSGWFVIPIVMLFVKDTQDELPVWFAKLWGPLEPLTTAPAKTYEARVLWLLKNRSSALASYLISNRDKVFTKEAVIDKEVWSYTGNQDAISTKGVGCIRVGDKFQVIFRMPFTILTSYQFRLYTNFGYNLTESVMAKEPTELKFTYTSLGIEQVPTQ